MVEIPVQNQRRAACFAQLFKEILREVDQLEKLTTRPPFPPGTGECL